MNTTRVNLILKTFYRKCRSRKKYSRKDTQRQALKTKEKSNLNSHNINFNQTHVLWKNNYLVPCCEVIVPKHILSIQKLIKNCIYILNLKSSFQKYVGRNYKLTDSCGILVSQFVGDVLLL
jgi:hypothetical protein